MKKAKTSKILKTANIPVVKVIKLKNTQSYFDDPVIP
jgi:hypothetical protein